MADPAQLLHNFSVPGFGSVTYFDSVVCESGRNASISFVLNLEHLTDLELIRRGVEHLDFVRQASEQPFTAQLTCIRVIIKLDPELSEEAADKFVQEKARLLMDKIIKFGTRKAAIPRQRGGTESTPRQPARRTPNLTPIKR